MATLKKKRGRTALAESDLFPSASTAPGGRTYESFSVSVGDFTLSLDREEAGTLAAYLARCLGTDTADSGSVWARSRKVAEPLPLQVRAWNAAGVACQIAHHARDAEQVGPHVGQVVAAPYGEGTRAGVVVATGQVRGSVNPRPRASIAPVDGDGPEWHVNASDLRPLPGAADLSALSGRALIVAAVGRFLSPPSPDNRPADVASRDALAVGFPGLTSEPLAEQFRAWAAMNARDGGVALSPTGRACAHARAAAFLWAARAAVMQWQGVGSQAEQDARAARGAALHAESAESYAAMTAAAFESVQMEQDGRAAVLQLARVREKVRRAAADLSDLTADLSA